MDNQFVVDVLSNAAYIGKNGDVVDSSFMFSVDMIGIYFSAHWCPPCKKFTPVLADFYREVNKNGKRMEIIFASCDKDVDKFNEYFNEMPWISFPFEDSAIDTLSNAYECQGIPYLVVIKPDGKLVSKNGRNDVGKKGDNCFEYW
jgi:thiol-disulfide isomerase/thioredoxin